MMHSPILVIALILISLSNKSYALNMEWSGSFEHEVSIATQERGRGGENDNRWIKSENLFQLETSGDIQSIYYKIDGRYRHDLKDELDSSRNELQFREAFLEYQGNIASIRFGKQTIVWGQADGIRLLDIINPLNFREFVLDEYDNSRIARTALTTTLPFSRGSELSLSILTEHAANRYPNGQERFALALLPDLPPDTPIQISPLKEPGQSLSESDYALRYATFAGSWDISFNLYRHYSANPRVRIITAEEGLQIHPTYERNTLIGGSANNAFGDFVFRSELVYNTIQYYQSNDPSHNFSEESPELQYILGADYSGLSDNLISAQWFQWRTLEHQKSFTGNKIRNTLTLLWRRFYMNNSLTSEILHIQELNNSQDGLLRSSLRYEVSGNILIKSGLDLFFGGSEGLYGQFNNKDQITVGIEIGF